MRSARPPLAEPLCFQPATEYDAEVAHSCRRAPRGGQVITVVASLLIGVGLAGFVSSRKRFTSQGPVDEAALDRAIHAGPGLTVARRHQSSHPAAFQRVQSLRAVPSALPSLNSPSSISTANARATERYSPSRSGVAAHATSEAEALTMKYAGYELDKAQPVFSVETGQKVKLSSLWGGSQIYVLVFLTHWGDLSSWELAQKIQRTVAPKLKENGVPIFMVGLGSVDGGRKFSELVKIPMNNLYACPSGELYKDMEFYQGFGPNADISPYWKLLPMLLGIGSPGTIQEVLRGYVGDKKSKQIFQSGPFDVVGKGSLRPFELATVRLLNMIGTLSNWETLVPLKTELITQQGGAVVLQGSEIVHMQKDQGILVYSDVEMLLEAALQEKLKLIGDTITP